jgi:hypothetical protein
MNQDVKVSLCTISVLFGLTSLRADSLNDPAESQMELIKSQLAASPHADP